MSKLEDRLRQTRAFESKAHEAMLSLIVAAVAVRDRVEKKCREYDLSFSHYNILRILRGAPETGYPRCDIIERMLDPAPDVTRLIDTLVEKGFVRRQQCTEDRRRTMHWITDEGLRMLDRMQQDMVDLHVRFGEPFSETELAALTGLCERVFTGDG